MKLCYSTKLIQGVAVSFCWTAKVINRAITKEKRKIQGMTDKANRKQRLKYININTMFNHSTGKRQCHTKSQRTYIQYRYIHIVSPLDWTITKYSVCFSFSFAGEPRPSPQHSPLPPRKKRTIEKTNIFTTSTTPHQQLIKQSSNTVRCWQFSPLSVTRLLIQSPIIIISLAGAFPLVFLYTTFTQHSHKGSNYFYVLLHQFYSYTLSAQFLDFLFTSTTKNSHHF